VRCFARQASVTLTKGLVSRCEHPAPNHLRTQRRQKQRSGFAAWLLCVGAGADSEGDWTRTGARQGQKLTPKAGGSRPRPKRNVLLLKSRPRRNAARPRLVALRPMRSRASPRNVQISPVYRTRGKMERLPIISRQPPAARTLTLRALAQPLCATGPGFSANH